MATLTLTISEKALATITAAAINSVPGTVRVSRRASKDLPRVDVQLNPESHAASVEAFIGVQWPAPISEVSQAVIDTVTTWLNDFAGVTAKKVTVVVDELVRGKRVVSTTATTPPITIQATAPKHRPKEISVPAHADWKDISEPQLRKIRHSRSVHEVKINPVFTGKVREVTRRDVGEFAKEPQIRHKKYKAPKVGVIGKPSWKHTTTPYIMPNEYSRNVWAPQVNSRIKANKPRRLNTQWSRQMREPQARRLPVWKPKATPLKVYQPQARPLEVRYAQARELPVWQPQINSGPLREVRLPAEQPLKAIEIRPVTARQLRKEAKNG